MTRTINSRAPTKEDRDIGSRVRLLRTLKGFSQQVVAEQLGFTYQQLQKVETGQNRLTAGRLLRIAEILDASPMDILRPPRDAGRLGVVADLKLPPHVMSLLTELHRSPDGDNEARMLLNVLKGTRTQERA